MKLIKNNFTVRFLPFALRAPSKQVTRRLLTDWSNTEGKRLQIKLAGCVELQTNDSSAKLWK